MTRKDYEEMKQKLRKDYEEKLIALDKVFEFFGPKKAIPADSTIPASRSWEHQTSKRDAVRDAIKELPEGEFTIHTVRQTLSHSQPAISKDIKDNQISSIVSILASNKEIEQVRPKTGKNPAVYKRKQTL